MSRPSIDFTVLDNQLGIRAPADAVLAIVGTAGAGAFVTPQAFTRTEDVVTEHASGRLVEAAAYAIERFGLTVLLVRSRVTTAGAIGPVDTRGVAGTSLITGDVATVQPLDDYELVLEFLTGATVGVAGATYRYSLDNGESWSETLALGTANTITITEAGIKLALAAGTVVAEDVVRAVTTGPSGDDDDLTEALEALRVTAAPWTMCLVMGDLDSSAVSAIDAKAEQMATAGRPRRFIGHTRIPRADVFKTETGTITFAEVGASGDTITRSAGSFVVDGFRVGDTITVTGAIDGANNIVNATIAGVSASTLTLGSTDLVAEVATGGVQITAPGESNAGYVAALPTEFASDSCKRLVLTAAACKIDSSVSRKRFRRPPAHAVAALLCSVDEEIDIAELDLGALPGVYIKDANGNPDEHDETINPGLDDARFCVLRSWEGREGVRVNNPRLFSPAGSDYLYAQLGRVVDLACTIARKRLEPQLSKGVFVIPDGSGRIDPADKAAIEGLVNGDLTKQMVGKRKCTRALFQLNGDDDVLTTGEQSWRIRIVPLAYIKKMRGQVALVASDKAPATVTG